MRLRRWAVLLAVLALVAAACGSERDTGSGDGQAGDGTTEDTGEDTSADAIGTLDNPCGPADGDAEGALASLSQDGGETQGITDDSITVGTFADPGFEQIPGLNQEMFDSAEAFAGWCNSQGGIDGRELVVNLRDAAVLDYPARVDEACAQDFAVVGGGAALDETGAQALTDCGLISIPGFAVSGPAALADNVVQVVPTNPYVKPTNWWLAAAELMAEEGLDAAEIMANTGLVFSENITSVLQTTEQTEAMLDQLGGWEIVHRGVYDGIAGEDNWSPFAAGIEADGVQILNFAGAPGNNLEQLQAALAQLGYTPDVILQEANFYDIEYAEAIDGVNPDARQWVRGSVWPVELADENPATQNYVDSLAEFGPSGAEPALLGIHTWSAFLFFSTLADECSKEGDLTRTCVFDKAKDTTEWDGGGLHPPTNPASNEPSECALLLEAIDGGFEIVWPADAAPDQGTDGYYCTDLARVEGDWGEGVVAGGG